MGVDVTVLLWKNQRCNDHHHSVNCYHCFVILMWKFSCLVDKRLNILRCLGMQETENKRYIDNKYQCHAKHTTHSF
jgi:hypothetical protein